MSVKPRKYEEVRAARERAGGGGESRRRRLDSFERAGKQDQQVLLGRTRGDWRLDYRRGNTGGGASGVRFWELPQDLMNKPRTSLSSAVNRRRGRYVSRSIEPTHHYEDCEQETRKRGALPGAGKWDGPDTLQITGFVWERGGNDVARKNGKRTHRRRRDPRHTPTHRNRDGANEEVCNASSNGSQNGSGKLATIEERRRSPRPRQMMAAVGILKLRANSRFNSEREYLDAQVVHPVGRLTRRRTKLSGRATQLEGERKWYQTRGNGNWRIRRRFGDLSTRPDSKRGPRPTHGPGDKTSARDAAAEAVTRRAATYPRSATRPSDSLLAWIGLVPRASDVNENAATLHCMGTLDPLAATPVDAQAERFTRRASPSRPAKARESAFGRAPGVTNTADDEGMARNARFVSCASGTHSVFLTRITSHFPPTARHRDFPDILHLRIGTPSLMGSFCSIYNNAGVVPPVRCVPFIDSHCVHQTYLYLLSFADDDQNLGVSPRRHFPGLASPSIAPMAGNNQTAHFSLPPSWVSGKFAFTAQVEMPSKFSPAGVPN
ncbi:hypothetical protein C8R46DRAFT_1027740 [Mycena filopes]|nr:hypothetical protein C8R46DRAFT_1027740 [Mycena filopes]